jgi:hypothetical protein
MIANSFLRQRSCGFVRGSLPRECSRVTARKLEQYGQGSKGYDTSHDTILSSEIENGHLRGAPPAPNGKHPLANAEYGRVCICKPL